MVVEMEIDFAIFKQRVEKKKDGLFVVSLLLVWLQSKRYARN